MTNKLIIMAGVHSGVPVLGPWSYVWCADSPAGLTLEWNKAIINAVCCTCAFLALRTPNVSVGGKKNHKKVCFWLRGSKHPT